MKKTVIIALVLTIVLSMSLFACKKSGDNGTSTQGEPDAATTAAKEAVEDPNTVAPGVAWSDLVPVTDEPSTDESADVTAGTDDTTEKAPFSGIELPIIPIP